ncbi:MAG: AAA family ATPase [Patescibacteria group bacterium]
MNLSLDQKKAVKALLDWFHSKNKTPVITLGGYAGTGKTTLISYFRKKLYDNSKKTKVAFCSYTGRATQNLKNKLGQNATTYWQDKLSTIHGLMYNPIENAHQEIVGWEKKEQIEADLIIIDEASMVDELIFKDLLSFTIPIIAVGDHGQLPPINGNFNLMQTPNITLTQIHRQAKDNPIIKISILAREKGSIPVKSFGKNISKYALSNPEASEISSQLLKNYSPDTLILCGYNSTRTKINSFIRSDLGFDTPTPQANDRVICLRNNHEKSIYNGMLGTVLKISKKDENWFNAEIEMDGSEKLYSGLIFAPQFGALQPVNFTQNRRLALAGDLFDFGYALTVHKAQGSQAKRVILFEEKFQKMDKTMWKRWLYTGITRAEEELFLFGN